jgi:muconolactone delta-isomerase
LRCAYCGGRIKSGMNYFERREWKKIWRSVGYWKSFAFDSIECLREFAHDPTIGT